jgi:hypothetical protein
MSSDDVTLNNMPTKRSSNNIGESVSTMFRLQCNQVKDGEPNQVSQGLKKSFDLY